jgi:hypothetical protein
MAAVIGTAIRILTFRASRDELVAMDGRHLAFGLVCTWLVGIGRWWDDPGAHLLQHLGLGSVIYVFVLSAFLWLLIRPLNPKDFTFVRLLTFVTLTAPPAILYALPVERWTSMDEARVVNACFLGVVAIWRVALFAMFLRRVAQFRWSRLVLAMGLPVSGILTALTLLNLERAVFNVMAGIREEGAPDPGTSNDLAYEYLFFITAFSVLALPVIIGFYFFAISMDVRSYIREQELESGPES